MAVQDILTYVLRRASRRSVGPFESLLLAQDSWGSSSRGRPCAPNFKLGVSQRVAHQEVLTAARVPSAKWDSDVEVLHRLSINDETSTLKTASYGAESTTLNLNGQDMNELKSSAFKAQHLPFSLKRRARRIGHERHEKGHLEPSVHLGGAKSSSQGAMRSLNWNCK
jgi:hypothetical protein